MNLHPAQSNEKLKATLVEAFRKQIAKKGILPRDPWKAKKVSEWIESLGGRMTPCRKEGEGCRVRETDKFVNFWVPCIPIAGGKIQAAMWIEIPWEVADKILVLNYFPE